MSAYPSVENLLRELGGKRERTVINHLFLHKTETFDTVVYLSNGDLRFVNSLIAKQILIKNGQSLLLDDRIRIFFENFLEINQDIQHYQIDDRIDGIKNQIQLFGIEDNWSKKEKIISSVKTRFIDLGRVINRNVIDLNRTVQQDYKTEESLKVKRFKIEKHEKKAEKLRSLIAYCEDVIESNSVFFEESSDSILNQILVDLKYDCIRKAKVSLRELHQEILHYLNKFTYLNEFFTKLQTIRKMKNHFELEQKSTVEECLISNNALIFEPRISLPTNPSLSYLETDLGYDLILNLNQKIKHKSKRSLIKSKPLSQKVLETKTLKEKWFDYKSLKDKYLKSDLDLFSYLLDYEFGEKMSLEDRVKVFCKIALLYENELYYTGHVEVYKTIRYAIINNK